MTRYFTSMVTVVILIMVLIAWAPTARSGVIPADQCLDFCEDQAICKCAKILGGALRLTLCNIGASCEFTGTEFECVCDVDPLCNPWEKDVVVQSFPVPSDDDCAPEQ